MLNTIPISERGTLAMICEDALVGYPSIDPRKFVDVYIKRRKAEIAGIPYNNVNESITASSRKEDDGGWTPVGNKPPLPVDASSQSLPGKSKPTTTKAKKKGKK